MLDPPRARPCWSASRAEWLREQEGAGVWLTDVISDHNVESFCLVIKVIMFALRHSEDIPQCKV